MKLGRYVFWPRPEPDEEAALRQALCVAAAAATASAQHPANGWLREARREAVGRAGDDDE